MRTTMIVVTLLPQCNYVVGIDRDGLSSNLGVCRRMRELKAGAFYLAATNIVSTASYVGATTLQTKRGFSTGIKN